MQVADMDKTQPIVFRPQQFAKPQASRLRDEVQALQFEVSVLRGAVIALLGVVLWLI